VLAARTTAEDSERAAGHFQTAVELDPAYAGAWAGMALNLALMATYIGNRDTGEALLEARTAAERALAIDERLASPYLALGEVLLGYDWDIAGAIEMFRRAVDLEPGKSEPHLYLGRCLVNTGRFDEGFTELERALELDPLSSLARARLAIARFYAGDYDKANEQIDAVAELDPGFPIDFARTLVWHKQGRLAESLAAAKRCPVDWQRLAMVALAAWDLGKQDVAHAALAELTDQHAHTAALQIAQVHCQMGDREATLEWLEQAYRNHDAGLVQLKVMPYFDALRGEEEFQDIMRRVGHAV
jgi:tetratricopeptide (TPR) repeat protein